MTSKEKLFVFQQWQGTSFDKKEPAAAQKIEDIAPPVAPMPLQPSPPLEPQIKLPTAEEIERIHEEARASGYEAGLAEGRTAGELAAREIGESNAQRFAALIGNLEHALSDLDQSVADQLLALALETAAQLVRGSIAAKPDVLIPIIREAITTLPLHHAHMIARLNPADAANVRDYLGEQFSQTGTQIIEDSSISPGGCQLLAGASEIDATIETRWKRVLEAIGSEPQEWLTP